MAEQTWGIEVNEVAIFANGLGADWWSVEIGRMELSGRAVPLELGPCGGLWWIGCADKEEAEFARDHMISKGVHSKAVTVRRSPSKRGTRLVGRYRPVTADA